jgi:hypothetical protein
MGFLALLPLVAQLLPQLTGLLTTPLRDSVLGKAADVAQRVFGTTSPEELQLRMKQDEEATKRFIAELQKETAEEQAFYADIRSAREQTVQLAQSGSVIAWGAPAVSTLVTLGFFLTLGLFISRTLDLPDFQQAVVNVLLGYLGAAFQQVVNYWLGSSRDSQVKTNLIANAAATAQRSSSKLAEVTAVANTSRADEGRMFR